MCCLKEVWIIERSNIFHVCTDRQKIDKSCGSGPGFMKKTTTRVARGLVVVLFPQEFQTQVLKFFEVTSCYLIPVNWIHF